MPQGVAHIDVISMATMTHSHSTNATITRKRKDEKTYGNRDKIKWSSNWEFVLVTMCAIISTNIIDRDCTYFGKEGQATILQFFVALLFIGMPIMHAEIFLGQYTELGPTQLKNLNPVAHGLGCSMVITCIIRVIKLGMDIADMLMYLIITFHMDYLHCPKDVEENCLSCTDLNKCSNDYCKDNVVNMSTQIYYQRIILGNYNFQRHILTYEFPTVVRMALITASWTIILLMIIIIKKFHKMARIAAIITELLLLVLFLVVIVTPGASNGIDYYFSEGLVCLFSWSTWLKAVGEVIEKFGIGRAIIMMQGSYLPTNKSVGLVTFGCFFVMIITYTLITLMMYAAMGIIQLHSGFNGNDATIYLLRHDEVPAQFTVIPQATGFMHAKQIWTFFYFASCFIIDITNQLIHIFIVERALIDLFPVLQYYKRYTMGILLCSFYTFGILLSGRGMFQFMRHLFIESLPLLEIFNTAFFTVVVFYFYKVQRIVDDIIFMTNSRPSFFWIMCWYMSPITIIDFVYEALFSSVPQNETMKVVHYILLCILILPVIICLFIEILRHLKRHNLSGILLPSERWGPADPEERNMRHKFNPRLEIRCRRRREVCPHRCLLNSRILNNYLNEECNARSEMKDIIDEYDNKATENSEEFSRQSEVSND